MSTMLSPIRPPSVHRGPGRIVERTTTITREIFLDEPQPAPTTPSSLSRLRAEASPAALSVGTSTETPVRGLDRALVRLGVWLIEMGRRHSLRPTRSADEIARRVDAAKAHNMKHFIGLPS